MWHGEAMRRVAEFVRIRSCHPLKSHDFSYITRVAAMAYLLIAHLSIVALAEDEPGIDGNAELVDLLAAAREYKLRITKSEKALEFREPSVLNFTNPERNQERGSVFVWMHDGRPAAIGQFFRFTIRGTRLTKHALHSLSSEPLEARFGEVLAWAPDKPGIEWKPFSDAPAPGPTRTSRLLQMRQLARRFKLTLTSPKDKSEELRLAPRPLFEYSAPKSGVTDGVILSYVVATDPEAILLIEAFDEKGKAGFRYAFARFHFWRLTAAEGERTVWDVAYDPDMAGNSFANPETVHRVYNSFHPLGE
jgi:hypothetical protein